MRRPNAPECDCATLADALADGAVLIDVRMPDEYVQARIRGARLIPLNELGARAGEIPQGETVYMICAGGGRSLSAAEALNNAGWTTVSVAGGTKKWVAEGRPFDSGPEE